MTQSKPFRGGNPLRALRGPLFAMVLAIVSVGCDSQDSSSSQNILTNVESPLTTPDRLTKLRKAKFLNLTERDAAAEWLALQEHRDDVSYRPTPDDVATYERRIALLAKLTDEDRRMVANRTVQTRDLLAEQNIHESLLTLLDGMTDVAKASVVGNYSAYCQWYVNLRQSRLDHQQALQQMTSLKRAP
ncbi:hypothetical protein [Methylocaldum szegediense]|uniref:DUF4142 domain-containing protein n=1 Tax=Methylocaldum szegediense TaxID=73780 RepID=A0ABM9I1D6_9GAMM|nr:hypothetical protein [Methylocaldum szegediense]CAI8825320.1 conserved protein of unknown function [Methylocaldum szegediense]